MLRTVREQAWINTALLKYYLDTEAGIEGQSEERKNNEKEANTLLTNNKSRKWLLVVKYSKIQHAR